MCVANGEIEALQWKRSFMAFEEFISFLTQQISIDIIRETKALCGPPSFWKVNTVCGDQLSSFQWVGSSRADTESSRLGGSSGRRDGCTWYTLSTYFPNFRMNGSLWQILQMKEKLKGENITWRICIHIWQKTSKALECFQHLSVISCLGNFPKEVIYSEDMHDDGAGRAV